MPLLTPKISLTSKDRGALQRVRKAIEKAGDAYVSVGVHEGAGQYPSGESVVSVALQNEFGTDRIPERSFLRSAMYENIKAINDWRTEALLHMVVDGWSVEKALTMIGIRLQILVQNKIKSNIPPPNAPATQEQKRKDGVAQRTLIHTELLLRSVGYRVRVKGGEKV